MSLPHNSLLDCSAVFCGGDFAASTPAPSSARSRLPNRAAMAQHECVQCHKKSPTDELRCCYSCGTAVHPMCISLLISATGNCVCGDGCAFIKFPLSSNKRVHMDLSDPSPGQAQSFSQIPDRVSFKTYAAKLSPSSTILDFAKELAAYFDKKQDRDEAIEMRNSTVINSIKDTVNSHSAEILEGKKITQNHDVDLALFKLTVGGIHGEKLDEIRQNFIKICSFLNITVLDSNISYVRFLKQDKSSKKVKSHNIVVRLHSSQMVADILAARKDAKKANEHKPLMHSAVFPLCSATSRILYLRPMLTDSKYKLLQLASVAKVKLGYKYCWAGDNGTIYLKKDDSAEPIIVRNEHSLTAIDNSDN